MIKIENVVLPSQDQWQLIIMGTRNPKNSWNRSDSEFFNEDNPDDNSYIKIGPNDHKLMSSLAKGGPVHAKYRRMIIVYMDITAPLYWWKEFDTYKIGTVGNSCSTMHKIHEKEFELSDFSFDEDLMEEEITWTDSEDPLDHTHFDMQVEHIIDICESLRRMYNNYTKRSKDTNLTDSERKHFAAAAKRYWRMLIQLLPTSYNQKRTIMLNYEVLHNMYHSRKHHKLDEWKEFCKWIEALPYSELIIAKGDINNA